MECTIYSILIPVSVSIDLSNCDTLLHSNLSRPQPILGIDRVFNPSNFTFSKHNDRDLYVGLSL